MSVIKKIAIAIFLIAITGCQKNDEHIQLINPSEIVIPFASDAQYIYSGSDESKLWFLQYEGETSTDFWYYDLHRGEFKNVAFTNASNTLNIRSIGSNYFYIKFEYKDKLVYYQVLTFDGNQEKMLFDGTTNDFYALPAMRVEGNDFYVMANQVVLDSDKEVSDHSWTLYRYRDDTLDVIDSWTSLEKGVVPFSEFRIINDTILYRKIGGIDDQFELYVSSFIKGKFYERYAIIDEITVQEPVLMNNHIYIQEKSNKKKFNTCKIRQFNIQDDSNKIVNYDLGLCFEILRPIDNRHSIGTIYNKYYILTFNNDSVDYEVGNIHDFMEDANEITYIEVIAIDKSVYFVNRSTKSVVKTEISYTSH